MNVCSDDVVDGDDGCDGDCGVEYIMRKREVLVIMTVREGNSELLTVRSNCVFFTVSLGER